MTWRPDSWKSTYHQRQFAEFNNPLDVRNLEFPCGKQATEDQPAGDNILDGSRFQLSDRMKLRFNTLEDATEATGRNWK